MSSIVNKIKDAVSGDKTHQQPEGTHGPHSSKAANAADPRIDSDRDHRANPRSTVGGGDAYAEHATHTGTHAGTGTGYTGSSNYTTGSTNHGPHDSNLLNKADPRIDSDRDHRANPTSNVGGTGYGASTGTTGGLSGSSGTTGAYYSGANTGTHGTHGTSTHGPHDSNLLNKADPRVDSDRDHRANPASNVGGTGIGGTHTAGHTTTGAGYGTTGTTGSTNHGPHDSNLLNKADPRFDSDRDHRANPTSNVGGTGIGSSHTAGHTTGNHGTTGTHNVTGTHGHSGPGPAPNTAGPHKSDALNKIDPRVDSDLDGSKTVGGNKTFASSNTTRDPTDASQVPPSVLRKHVGDPTIHHDDHTHNRERRNSLATHQETHRGI